MREVRCTFSLSRSEQKVSIFVKRKTHVSEDDLCPGAMECGSVRTRRLVAFRKFKDTFEERERSPLRRRSFLAGVSCLRSDLITVKASWTGRPSFLTPQKLIYQTHLATGLTKVQGPLSPVPVWPGEAVLMQGDAHEGEEAKETQKCKRSSSPPAGDIRLALLRVSPWTWPLTDTRRQTDTVNLWRGQSLFQLLSKASFLPPTDQIKCRAKQQGASSNS